MLFLRQNISHFFKKILIYKIFYDKIFHINLKYFIVDHIWLVKILYYDFLIEHLIFYYEVVL